MFNNIEMYSYVAPMSKVYRNGRAVKYVWEYLPFPSKNGRMSCELFQRATLNATMCSDCHIALLYVGKKTLHWPLALVTLWGMYVCCRVLLQVLCVTLYSTCSAEHNGVPHVISGVNVV